jgi:hypothetical protein
MKPDPRSSLAPPGPAIWRRPAWRFALVLAALLLALCMLQRPKHFGDVLEYIPTTVALANHGTPDIRATDLAGAMAVVPDLAPPLGEIAGAISRGEGSPEHGILRTGHGYFAMHFFAYPALAALPFKVLKSAGIDPLRCFQLVNSAALFVLGMALLRLFGNARRAAVFMLCYLMCGGMLYWQWSSPETISAAGLLAGLIFYSTGAPIAGGLLAGLGSTQNPPILLFCVFAPLLRACLPGKRSGAARIVPDGREFAGLVLCGLLAMLPAAFDLVVFGTPSIIGKLAADPQLVTGHRLFSFFFDLNQGLLLGVPAVAAALLLWRVREPAAWQLTLAAALFAVAMAGLSLLATNWNSGAEGITRYALWVSMPLLFAFAWRLRFAQRWPAALVAVVLVVQTGAMLHARRYTYLEFSPLARMTMQAAPGWYNPEPEIFAERVTHADAFNAIDKVLSWSAPAKPVKILYNARSDAAQRQLCGNDAMAAASSNSVDAGSGWRYINGNPTCLPVLRPGQPNLVLASGWSEVEHGGADWEGAWSDGARSRLELRIDPRNRPVRVTLHGHYVPATHRTRVAINGKDLGWQALDQLPELPVPAGADGDRVVVDLQFDATTTPSPRDMDQRHLGYFLQKVTMQ